MSSLKRSTSDIWKGMAIGLVVLVHWLAVFPDTLYLEADSMWWSIPFQTLVRLSVPLFLALSGYGLSKKYAQTKINGLNFFVSRLGKLLPLYLLWSIVIGVTLQLNPQWRIMPIQPLWQQLLLGTADYQLYFVPLILQLYFLFPIFHHCKPKTLWWLTVLAFGVQIFLALALRWSWFHPGLIPLSWLDDQFQYRLFFHWWGYFLLGQTLADSASSWSTWSRTKISLMAIILASFIWTTLDTHFLLQNTHDVIFATSFLRMPVIVFSLATIVLILKQDTIRFLPRHFANFLAHCGQHSFLIFLSHTTVLRLIFALVFEPHWKTFFDWPFVLSACFTALAGIFSFWLTQRSISIVPQK